MCVDVYRCVYVCVLLTVHSLHLSPNCGTLFVQLTAPFKFLVSILLLSFCLLPDCKVHRLT